MKLKIVIIAIIGLLVLHYTISAINNTAKILKEHNNQLEEIINNYQ